MTDPPMLSAALTYADRGWPVFPCGQDKRPLTQHGFKDASVDRSTIKSLCSSRPDVGIGIPTGAPSGLVVLDVDVAHGGTKSLEALERQYGQLSGTLEAITGGGGRHLFFQARGLDVRNSAGKLGSGLDIRGTGGYIIAPPSLHPSGARYRWKNYSTPIADMPPWLEKLLVKPSRKAPSCQVGNNGKIPVGQRRSVALSLAGALRRKGADEATICAKLVAANTNNDPPLPDEELRALARDVYMRYAPTENPVGSGREDTSKAAVAPLPEVHLHDMPETCLIGRLGDIAQQRMGDLPRAYSWPALLGVGSGMIAEQPQKPVRTNLFVALVGPVHSGKTEAIDRAIATLGLEPPQLVRVYSGSMEQLARKLSDAQGNPRVLVIDELMHLFQKSQIDRASFTPVLANAFNSSHIEMTLGRKAKDDCVINCPLSIIGGIVEERFQESFAHNTIGGMHDRFMFGLFPGNFRFDYTPFEGEPENLKPILTCIDPSVWEAKKEYLRAHPEMNPRVVEISIRAQVIAYGSSGYKILCGKDLAPAFAFAEYQMALREILAPNPGQTIEGKVGHLLLNELMRHKGKSISRRDLLRRTHAYDYGASIADRFIAVLKANGEIQTTKVGKRTFIRYVPEDEPEPDEAED